MSVTLVYVQKKMASAEKGLQYITLKNTKKHLHFTLHIVSKHFDKLGILWGNERTISLIPAYRHLVLLLWFFVAAGLCHLQ